MNSTRYTITEPYAAVTTQATGASAHIVNRNEFAITVKVRDQSGADDYTLTSLGDDLVVDLIGVEEIVISADQYPADILLQQSSQNVMLNAPGVGVAGGMQMIDPAHPIPVDIVGIMPVAQASQIVVCECSTPAALAGGTGLGTAAFDAFYDQAGDQIKATDGSTTDADVIAAFAALGLTISSDGKTLTATGTHLYAFVFTTQASDTNSAYVAMLKGSAGGLGFQKSGTAVAASASTAAEYGFTAVDVLTLGDTLTTEILGTPGDSPYQYATLTVVKIF